MKKRGWLIPILIVAINALTVAVRWSSLAEQLPAHFDLQGHASGTMARSVLLLYPLMGAMMCLVAYLIARKLQQFHTGLVVLASGGCLVLLSSTMVTLTAGTMPIFMLADPAGCRCRICDGLASLPKSVDRLWRLAECSIRSPWL